MSKFKIRIIALMAILLSCTQAIENSTSNQETDIVKATAYYDSGGIPIKEQSAYDVNYYDLALAVQPDNYWIGGNLQMTATAVEEIEVIVLHLDTLLEVSKTEITTSNEIEARWERKEGLLYIYPEAPISANSVFSVKISYSGNPLRVEDAARRSWADGFYFEKTPSGQPWVSNVSVLNGADIWFPCKDHPSDEPDSMAINITVDNDLVVASNGVLRSISENEDQTNTYHWFVSNPINNYAVSINIAPYETIEEEYTSITGETFPFIFWAIPEHVELAKAQFPNFIKDMRYLEELLGPYPFRAEKYGVAETFYFGMETQSIIAYGNDFTLNDYGFDGLHFHELVHEWFANMVTAEDWKHWWIHESFATYAEPLYAEYLGGEEAYRKYMSTIMSYIRNRAPIVLSQDHVSTREGYIGDVYGKGAAILHTLRFIIGKEKMLQLLRKMAYPDQALEKITDGSQTRFSNTDEFQMFAEEFHGSELDWFFDAYLFYAQLPHLIVTSSENLVSLEWKTESEHAFILSVPVEVNGEDRIIEMSDGKASFETNGMNYEIDPQNLILKKMVMDSTNSNI